MNNASLIKNQQWIQMPADQSPLLPGVEYSVDPQKGSVLDYWRILRRRKLPLIALGIVGLAAGLAVTFCQNPMYRATTALEIQDNKDQPTKMLAPANESTSADSLPDIQTQIRILQSKMLIKRVLDKLQGAPGAENIANSSFAASPFRLPSSHAPLKGEDLLEALAKQLKVSQSGQTRIVEISFESNDPAQAARFANALTAEFIQESLDSHLDMNRRTMDWLVSQLDDLRGKLRVSETALQNYARQQGLIYTNDNQSISEEKLRELQTELSKAQADRVQHQSRAEAAHNGTGDVVPDAVNDTNLRSMESALTDLRRQEADLRVVFKPDYTKTKRIQAEIDTLETAITAKRAQIVRYVDQDLIQSQRREQLLAAAFAKQMRSVADDSEKSIQYDMLKHEVDTNRQIYQAMLQRVKESSIDSAMKAANVRVVDPAIPPEHPYKPNLPVNGGAGALCGLMIGAGVMLVRTRTNANVQEPGDAGMLLGIPELGVIPAAEPSRQLPISTQTKLLGTSPSEAAKLHSSYSGNASVLADSYRSVLASILFGGARKLQQILVVTSANPGEGKTTAVTNLGATLASMNRKVLLIDGDIRSPHIHKVFGLDNSVGLTNVLQGIARHELPTGRTAILETAIPNLHVLTSGPAVEAGADLLFSTSMPALIARYRAEYDMVLIDTPPMLLMPDARFLGRVSDGVVLIARAGRTGRDAIQAACRRFVEDHTPVVGVVLNDWNAKFSEYGSYANYKDSAAAQPGPGLNGTGVRSGLV